MRFPLARGRVASCVLAAGALLALFAHPRAESRTIQPYVGITLIDRVEASPRPVHMHIAQIDLRAPDLRFRVSPPGGSREVVRETTMNYLMRQHAELAINGHFFFPFPSADTEAWVIGLGASDGHIYSTFETPVQDFALVGDAPALNIDRHNRARIVHRDTRRTDGRHVKERVTLWNVVAGSAQIVTGGVATIPTYADATHRTGLLVPGGPNDYSNAKSWYEVATARTAVGLSRDNRTLTLFTVDVRGGSDGLTVPEVAAVLIRDCAVWNALNLDGGGSTTMAWKDPATGEARLLNTSSDSPSGRAVASSLAVFARRR